jgi:adenylate kinase family enzyme
MVVGNGGAGKSTVAAEVGRRLDLPVIHLDRIFWKPGWVPSTPAQMRARVGTLVAGERWVMDGNYSASFDLRLARADLVVLLDLPRRVTLPAVLGRWWRYRGRTRPSMTDHCPERVSTEFLLYCWRYPRHSRPKLLAAVTRAGAEDRLVRLTRRRDVTRWLATLDAS